MVFEVIINIPQDGLCVYINKMIQIYWRFLGKGWSNTKIFNLNHPLTNRSVPQIYSFGGVLEEIDKKQEVFQHFTIILIIF